MVKIVSAVFVGLSGLFAWLAWGPVLHWIWAQFPKDASWYGFVKVGGIILVGCFGGIALPLVLLVLAAQIYIQFR